MKHRMMDERTEQINGLVSFLCLMLTQLALVGLIVYKRYFLGLTQQETAELTWIAFLSMGTYWALRLYFSGILPILSLRQVLILYFAGVALISIPTYFIHGWPAPERWYEVLYPVVGVAAALGFYSLAAYFGKRRLEKIGMQQDQG